MKFKFMTPDKIREKAFASFHAGRNDETPFTPEEQAHYVWGFEEGCKSAINLWENTPNITVKKLLIQIWFLHVNGLPITSEFLDTIRKAVNGDRPKDFEEWFSAQKGPSVYYEKQQDMEQAKEYYREAFAAGELNGLKNTAWLKEIML